MYQFDKIVTTGAIASKKAAQGRLTNMEGNRVPPFPLAELRVWRMRRSIGVTATQRLYKQLFLVSSSFEEEVMMLGRPIRRTTCAHSQGRHVTC